MTKKLARQDKKRVLDFDFQIDLPHSVPPSSSALIRAGKNTVSKYWDFDPRKRIRYRTDAEYEEHFRVVFGGPSGAGFARTAPSLPN